MIDPIVVHHYYQILCGYISHKSLSLMSILEFYFTLNGLAISENT